MTTTIGPHTRITGRITGDADLLVEGAVDGHIELASNLVIASSGSITGNVRALSVRIEGRLEGILNADHVHLTSTARVIAEQLTANLIQMDDGACIKGEIVMNLDGEVASAPAARPAPTHKPVTRPVSTMPARASTPAPPVTAPRAAPAATAQAVQAVQATTTVVVEEAAEEVEEAEEIATVDYEAMTVKELRDQLRELDLPVSGTKQELAERLAEAES